MLWWRKEKITISYFYSKESSGSIKYPVVTLGVVLYAAHSREDMRLTFVNTLRQLPSSHPRRPGDLCLPRLPGLYQWMLDGWFYGMDLWMDCWVILNFILWDDWIDLIMWEFQSEYELQCNEVLGWRRRAPTVEGFTKEVKVFSSNCLLASRFMWLRQFFSENVRAFLNFPGECALRPIHGGDHPEDCAGQVSLAPLHHHVNPQLENSCEATEWLPQSENLCEATRQPYEQSIWAIHQKILGNPGGCSGPVRVNLCSCFAEPTSITRRQYVSNLTRRNSANKPLLP